LAYANAPFAYANVFAGNRLQRKGHILRCAAFAYGNVLIRLLCTSSTWRTTGAQVLFLCTGPGGSKYGVCACCRGFVHQPFMFPLPRFAASFSSWLFAWLLTECSQTVSRPHRPRLTIRFSKDRKLFPEGPLRPERIEATGSEAKQTEHAGAKHGNSAYWGRKWEAKREMPVSRFAISENFKAMLDS
jgi:hypothetical protein